MKQASPISPSLLTPTEHANDGRTLMAAVLFADLVGYSRKPVTDQMAAKEAFRCVLQAALERFAPSSRVVVDTGDGAAVAFLADPEHALYFALRLRRDVQAGVSRGPLRPDDLRIGINLGPVRRAVDVNGRPNLVGEGMNSAERLMSFSAPGETTASRSFRDAVACLHASYERVFEPIGQRADKHGREHEVFRIVALQPAFEAATASLAPAPPAGAADAPESAGRPLAAKPRQHRRLTERRSVVAGGALMIALVAIGVTVWSLRGVGDPAPDDVQSASKPASAAGEVRPPSSESKGDAPPAGLAVEPVKDSEKLFDPAADPALPLEPQALPPREGDAPPAAPAPVPARGERAKAAKPAKAVRSTGAAPSARCTLLLQRAALGERLTAGEREELRTSCH